MDRQSNGVAGCGQRRWRLYDGVCAGVLMLGLGTRHAPGKTYNGYSTVQFTMGPKLRHLLSCAGGPRLVRPYFMRSPNNEPF